MDAREYLEALRSLVGGEIRTEEHNLGSPPSLWCHRRGHFVKFDFVVGGEIVLDVNTPPPHHLRLRKEGFVSRALGNLGVLADHKTGDPAFDDQYIIDNATREQVLKFLTPEVRSLIRRLEPFALFALTHKEYRCVKYVSSLEEYPPQDAAADVDTMIRIAELTQGSDGDPGAT